MLAAIGLCSSCQSSGTRNAASPDDVSVADFRSPPRDAHPTLWWRFLHDYISREGIAADVAAMRRTGVSGAVVSFCDSGPMQHKPQAGLPYVPILSDAWWKMLSFQLQQAHDGKLDLWFQACPGYATTGGPWITPELSMQKLVWSATTCDGGKLVEIALPMPAVDPKWNYYRDVAVIAYPTPAAGEAVAPERVVELSSRMDATGMLTWDAPPGQWTIARLGQTTTGKTVHPATITGVGLECDKLSRAATRVQFDRYYKQIRAHAPAGAKIELFVDSWEAGMQNWTPGFRETFAKRRGYDPLPWLLTVTGQLVGDVTLSRRFDLDWRRTIEELTDSEHVAELARLSHEAGGNSFRLQPYNGQYNFITAGALADIPEGEYWHVNKRYGWWTLRMIASISHITGKPLASAESLTASPEHLRFDVDPYATKAETDLAFTMGINTMAIPHIPHNPWPQWKPGMCAGPYGMMLGGGQVWNDLAVSWVTYLARCCHLLRQGTFVADVITLHQPGQRGFTPPTGYSSDLCDEARIIQSLTWDGESLVLPSGMRYRLLELVDTTRVDAPSNSPAGIQNRFQNAPMPQSIDVRLLRKVRDLVHAGATVVGPRPEIASGLSGYPGSDAEVARIAEELWGPRSAEPVDRRVGKGRVLSNVDALQALRAMRIEPDVRIEPSLPADQFPWIHRRVGESDVYFVSNQRDEAITTTVSFRVEGKLPELWHADTGLSEPAANWNVIAGRTDVTIDLDPRGSVFVVFRPGSMPPLPVKLARPTTRLTLDITGPWTVHFDEAMGAPRSVAFPELVSWADRPETGIRYYSGIARYERNVNLPADFVRSGELVMLDLGTVRNLARVTVNGHAMPELWKPPFRCDVTQLIKAGENKLEIEVVNVWANRLIGDEQEPADIDWDAERFNADKLFTGRALLRYPDWFVNATPRSSVNRRTFATWNFVRKSDPLLPAGLIGPVRLDAVR